MLPPKYMLVNFNLTKKTKMMNVCTDHEALTQCQSIFRCKSSSHSLGIGPGSSLPVKGSRVKVL